MDDIRPIAEIVSQFNGATRALITQLEMKSRDAIEIANLDRLKKRLSLLKSTLGDSAPIKDSAPFFIEFREWILEPDSNARDRFFLTLDVRAEYIRRKGTVAKEDEFMFSMVDSIRAHYISATQFERDAVYNNVKIMFDCCIEFAIAV